MNYRTDLLEVDKMDRRQKAGDLAVMAGFFPLIPFVFFNEGNIKN